MFLSLFLFLEQLDCHFIRTHTLIETCALQPADDDDEDEECDYRSRPPPPIPTSRPSSASATRTRETGREIGFGSSPRPFDDNLKSPVSSTVGRGRNASNRPDDLILNEDGAESPDNGNGNGNGTPKAPDATARYQKARYDDYL